MTGDDAGGAAAAPEAPFPRGTALPKQSPLFWVAEKDRYLRQLSIRDIEALTGRRLIVYFANCDSPDASAQIHPSDDAYLTELLSDAKGGGVDLMVETNGGYTDATEKLVAILRNLAPDLRVVVPRRAKSNGTLVALAAKSIVMGPGSELGPIDPNLVLGPQNQAPAQFILQAPAQSIDPLIRQAAQMAVAQTTKLATTLLETGMMAGKPAADIQQLVNKLATRDHFHSHGSVIDATEAKALGLDIVQLGLADDLWERLWLLRCMYAHDLKQSGLVKIFEGRFISNAFRAAQ